MRKIILSSVVLVLGILFSSAKASASNSSVNFSGPQTGIIQFCTSAGDPVLTLSSGGFGGAASMGSGEFAGATGFTLSGAPLRFTADPAGGFETNGTLAFALTGTSITGTLTDIKLTQLGQFIFLSGDLKTGSTTVQIGFIIDLPSGTSVAHLTGIEKGSLSVGEGLENSPTPEPGTMLLFGSGLLILAGVLRRKLVGTAVA